MNKVLCDFYTDEKSRQFLPTAKIFISPVNSRFDLSTQIEMSVNDETSIVNSNIGTPCEA